MTRIALTGAAGNVGREVLNAFDDAHDVVPFTHTETENIDSETLDITDRQEVFDKLDGFDVVIHLAGASSPSAGWEVVVETNVHGTKHVLDAAVENGTDRVVFASSNHAVGTYNAADPADPESMTIGYAHSIDANAPIQPDSYYGVSKAACEGLTRYYANRHGIEIINVRIGWYMNEEDLRKEAGGEVKPETERFARATWLSPRDCRNVHRRAAIADLPVNPLTVNAVSRNDQRFHSITETMRTIGYRPRDNADEVLD